MHLLLYFYLGFAAHCLEDLDKNSDLYHLDWDTGFGEPVHGKTFSKLATATSIGHDVATLREFPGEFSGKWGVLQLGNESDYTNGTPALVIGYPGAAKRIGWNLFSDVGKTLEIADEFIVRDMYFEADWCHDCIFLDSVNNPQSYGTSGGPVIIRDRDGNPKVIGVQTNAGSRKDKDGNVITEIFAVKSEYLLKTAQQLPWPKDIPQPTSTPTS